MIMGIGLVLIGITGFLATLNHTNTPFKANHVSAHHAQDLKVEWSFSKSEMAMFDAALKAEKANNEAYYHVTPPVDGYTYTVAEKGWAFRYQGQDYLAFSSDLRVKIITEDGGAETWVQTYEIFKPDGTYVTSVEQEIEDKKKFQVLVTLHHDGIQAHTFSWEKGQTQATEKTYTLPRLKYPYLENATYAFSQKWMSLPVKQKMHFNYFSNESVALSNFDLEILERKKWTPLAPWDIHFAVSKNGKRSSEVWLDSKRKLSSKISYGSTVLMPCSKHAMEAERSKPLADTNDNTAPLNFWLLDTDHLQQLKLKFSLKHSEEKALFTENTRQKVDSLPNEPTEIIVTLKANNPDSSEKPRAFYADEISDALKSTRFHQSNDPAIIDMAHHIVQQEKNPSKQALLLAKWVKENIRWTYAVLNGDARETLKSRIGDCSEHSALFVALARALNIPAQEVTGYRVGSTEIGSHAWAEIYDHGWKEIDPSDGKWISAAYLRMEHTILPAHIRKLQVLEVTYNGKTETVNSTKPYWWYHNGHYYNRALGLLMRIPPYLSYHVERLYPKWLFRADNTDTHFPIAQGPVENALFCVTWLPTLDNWADLLKQPSLLLSDMFVSVYPHDPELYNLNKDLAPNAVFNAFWHVESWQEKHGPYVFAVAKYHDEAGQQSIHYKIPLNNRIDIAFVIYGPFGAQGGHPKAPDAILDLLKGFSSSNRISKGNFP